MVVVVDVLVLDVCRSLVVVFTGDLHPNFIVRGGTFCEPTPRACLSPDGEFAAAYNNMYQSWSNMRLSLHITCHAILITPYTMHSYCCTNSGPMSGVHSFMTVCWCQGFINAAKLLSQCWHLEPRNVNIDRSLIVEYLWPSAVALYLSVPLDEKQNTVW